MKKILLFLTAAILFSTVIYSQSSVVQQIINSSSQDSLIYFVRELSGNVSTSINGTLQTILSRHKLQPGNALAETYIKQKLQSYGLTTTIQSFSTTGKNVYAVQPGNEFPNQKYIICAHYDNMPSGTTAPGADDNASGTAAVIEAARIFSQYSFPYTIVYALWDEEEQGLVGSNYYAAQASTAGDSILGVINMDMIAYDSNGDGIVNIHSRPTAGNSVELKDKMVECNSLYGINLSLVIMSPGSTYSDHASFWSRNYGAILLIEDDFDFHPYYHTVNDHIQYFNQPYFFKSAKLAYATLASFILNLNLNISHTPVTSQSQSAPVNTTAFISTGLTVGSGSQSPRLYYRSKQIGGTFGSFNSVTGTPAESGNYNFTIPQHALGTIVQYYIAAQDENSSIVKTLPAGGGGFNPPGNVPPPTFFQYYVASQVVELYDEANTISDWTSTGGWNTTTARFVSPPSAFTDSPAGNYANNTTAALSYNNQINLNGIIAAVLEFDTQWNIENDYDYGQVQISTNNGTTWAALTGQFTNPGTGTFQPNGEPLYDGTQTTWVHETIDISGYVNQNISLRFLLRTDASLTEDGWYIDNIRVTTFTSNFSLSVSVNDGWNMVSVPGLHPTDQNVNTWWANRNPLADVYKWTTTYVVVTTTTPTESYWMLHNGAHTYNYSGILFVTHNPIPVNAGWNMIGGYENTASVAALTTTPPGLIVPNTVYGWNGTYYNATNLEPGYGYWILLTGAGVINPPTLAKGSTLAKEEDRSEWGKITITDATGKSFVLYSVNEEVNLDHYQMPPLPPTGSFDVRYTSNRKAENLKEGNQTIEMRGMEYPVTIRVENANIKLQDETGKTVNARLKSGEELTINSSMVSKLMVSENIIPEAYSLEQNYPNPFNPSTVIEFSIPEDAVDVRLTIYNALGQKVAELVNTKLEAGKYQYKWDANDLASGLYIYELRTSKFNSVKKMILLR